MRKISVLSIIIIGAGVAAVAALTAQSPDRLIYKGQEYSIFANPLERYFKIHKEKRPSGGIVSTGLWRGYIATFEIKNDSLSVYDIEIEVSSKDTSGNRSFGMKSVLQEVFPDTSERFCKWFTGLLVLPIGEIKEYVHMGYGSLYEQYLILRIENGNFRKVKEFSGDDYIRFKVRQFEMYKKTDEFKQKMNKYTKDGYDAEMTEGFLFVYETDYTTQFLMEEI